MLATTCENELELVDACPRRSGIGRNDTSCNAPNRISRSARVFFTVLILIALPVRSDSLVPPTAVDCAEAAPQDAKGPSPACATEKAANDALPALPWPGLASTVREPSSGLRLTRITDNHARATEDQQPLRHHYSKTAGMEPGRDTARSRHPNHRYAHLQGSVVI